MLTNEGGRGPWGGARARGRLHPRLYAPPPTELDLAASDLERLETELSGYGDLKHAPRRLLRAVVASARRAQRAATEDEGASALAVLTFAALAVELERLLARGAA
ncbi:MAG: hypothetical protein AB7N76_19000 [Planctomycetota bacterium]